MDEKISKTIAERNKYLERLAQDFENNCQVEAEASKRLEELQDTIKTVNELGKQAEHVAMIPLANKIYMPGKIIHTGEYYVEKKAHPESYHVLQTLGQTLKSLEDRVSAEKDLLNKVTATNKQLQERRNILCGIQTSGLSAGETGDVIESGVTDDMPGQIQSDKGMAVKFGGFYEIIEYED